MATALLDALRAAWPPTAAHGPATPGAADWSLVAALAILYGLAVVAAIWSDLQDTLCRAATPPADPPDGGPHP